MFGIPITEGDGAYFAVYPYGTLKASQLALNHDADPGDQYTFLSRNDAEFWTSFKPISRTQAFMRAAACNVLIFLRERESIDRELLQ